MSESQPDLHLDVDGQVFEVRADPSQPGAYHYSWVTGPNVGYGFTSRRSHGGAKSMSEHEMSVRGFLAQIDPETGFIADEPDDDGQEGDD